MKLSLAKISFLNIVITALVFSIVIGVFTVIITNNSYDKKMKQQEETYIKKNKNLVKNEVNRIIKRITTLEKISYNTLRDDLEEKVDFVSSVFSNTLNSTLTSEELLKKYKSELNLLKWDNDSGYFYIFDSKGLTLYHGNNSEYVDQPVLDVVKNNAELKSFIEETLKRDENFGSYSWNKPHENQDKSYTKYVYAKKIDHLDIYVAAGIYKNEFTEQIQKLIFKKLRSERFGDGDYGYFWINDFDLNMRLHPIVPELEGTNVKEFKTDDGQYFFQNTNKIALEKKEGYIEYMWVRPDSKEVDEKISYVHVIEEWDMVIGSGFYLTELKLIHEKEKKRLKNTVYENLRKILLILGSLIVLSLISALLISQRIKKIEDSQKEHINMLEQYKLILDSSSVVSKTDKNGILTYVNQNFTKVSGYTLEEVIGSPHSIVRHPETLKSQFKKLWIKIDKGQIWKGLIKNRKKNGESYYNSTTIVPIRDSAGNVVEYISSGSDVTELIEKRSELSTMFRSDALTGLGNRVSLVNFLKYDPTGVLILINIDRFKEVNDIHGHRVGDIILKELGSRLFDFVSDDKYTLYRVQSDIFAIYALEVELEIVKSKLTRFMETVGRRAYVIDEHSFIFTYSAGIAFNDENIFTYADMALSEAKNQKIRMKVYEDSMNNIKEYKQNILWVKKLHLAIAEDRIVPFYQPIYNYHTGKIEKYECLMRLIEDGEVIPPVHYLPVAKKTKLYPELTYKMVAKSIDKFALLSQEFSINFSIEDLMNENLMQFVYDYAEQKEVFKRLVFEIVESEEIEDNDSITKIIEKFKAVGVKIAIDDFGSGYSNYSYLISLKADFIKIDGSIIEHLLEDDRTIEIVKSIITFAKKSDMKTIAEFVSSEELNDIVKALGVDYAQGYYHGRAEAELL